MHVTIRAREGLGSLRHPKVFPAVKDALKAANQRDDFSVVLQSVQSNHIHLIVEAEDTRALSLGMNGLSTRCAKAINKALGRTGPVWNGRYHAQELKNPTMVRNAFVYVLFNNKKHAPQSAQLIDPCSSARWFPDFEEPIPRPRTASPVRPPRTWLARVGWKRAGGPISIHERPAPPS